jgi:peptide/nickel transport system ATP-binding protein
MSKPTLEVAELEITYSRPHREKLLAVREVSFTVWPGQIYGLVGESGCGKTSIVRAVVGLQRPTKGQIYLNGDDMWSLRRPVWREVMASQIGVVFQNPTASLDPRMTVAEILQDPMRIHRVGSKAIRERRAAELLELVRLPTRALAQFPKELSGGQCQRVAIGRAIALMPKLLVADEPTAALDVSIRNQILNLLLDLRDELQFAMLVISHDIAAVSYLAGSLGVMYLGRLVETGSVAEVREHFEHPYTALLLSAQTTLQRSFRDTTVSASPIRSSGSEGCPFQPRCLRATEECSVAFPSATSLDVNHVVHCIHPLRDVAAQGTV